jgi:hypothetical protein
MLMKYLNPKLILGHWLSHKNYPTEMCTAAVTTFFFDGIAELHDSYELIT